MLVKTRLQQRGDNADIDGLVDFSSILQVSDTTNPALLLPGSLSINSRMSFSDLNDALQLVLINDTGTDAYANAAMVASVFSEESASVVTAKVLYRDGTVSSSDVSLSTLRDRFKYIDGANL